MQFQHLAEGERLAGNRIHGPACPQGFDPFPHHAVALKLRVSRGHQQWSTAHFREHQAALQQGLGWHGLAIAEANGPAIHQVAVTTQLLPFSVDAEGTPEMHLHVAAGAGLLKPMQSFDPVAPDLGLGQQGDLAVARPCCRVAQACEGFAVASEGSLQH